MEDEPAQPSTTYSELMDNFGSGVGSTLEDLKLDWPEDDYDFSAVEVPKKGLLEDKSRASSFKSQINMNSFDGMQDLSLKKARPLAFSNPVYDLLTLDETDTRSHQMTLIPLSQFDINKQQDAPTGKKLKKRGSHGFINKLSHFTIRKHSMKKNEPEINVTAPLWTDVPSVTYSDGPKRSASLKKTPSEKCAKNSRETESMQSKDSLERSNPDQPHSDDKRPPSKVPRSSPGRTSPLPPNEEMDPGRKLSDTVFEAKEDQAASAPGNDRLLLVKNQGSSGSTSDLSDDATGDEGQTTKTMMEVMNEMEDDSAPETMIPQPVEEDSDPDEDPPKLKRNKTLKWSGSRPAPALIREFTKKSRRNKSTENLGNESPSTPSHLSYEQSPSADSMKPKETGSNEQIEPGAVRDTSKAEAQSEGSPTEREATLVVNQNSGASNLEKRDSAFTILSALLPPAPKLRRSESSKIRSLVHRMGTNPQNALGYAAMQFVKQTINSSENRPVVLLHSIRSFLTDIKRYLLTNPQSGAMNKIKKIAKNVSDVEGAIDDALERLVLYPLRDHVYKCLVFEYAKSGKIKLLEEAIKAVKQKTTRDLGIRDTLKPPSDGAMEEIKGHFMELQSTYSPYHKLKHLLSAVTTIYQNTTDLTCEDQSSRRIGADDFLPLLVYSIVRCNFTAADIEAQYIDGLLDPSLLLGEGGYYLTTLISAVQVLCSMKRREVALPNVSDLQGFLKVGISSSVENGGENNAAAEISSSVSNDALLLQKTLHVPPSMTAHNLGMMIAKKFSIKNPKGFCLHVVVNNVAYPLKPQEFPQLVKMDLLTQFSPSHFYFIYRSIEKSPNKVVKPAEERPMTLDAEHLKVNTEDGRKVDEYPHPVVTVTEEIVQDHPQTGTESSAQKIEVSEYNKMEIERHPVLEHHSHDPEIQENQVLRKSDNEDPQNIRYYEPGFNVDYSIQSGVGIEENVQQSSDDADAGSTEENESSFESSSNATENNNNEQILDAEAVIAHGDSKETISSSSEEAGSEIPPEQRVLKDHIEESKSDEDSQLPDKNSSNRDEYRDAGYVTGALETASAESLNRDDDSLPEEDSTTSDDYELQSTSSSESIEEQTGVGEDLDENIQELEKNIPGSFLAAKEDMKSEEKEVDYQVVNEKLANLNLEESIVASAASYTEEKVSDSDSEHFEKPFQQDPLPLSPSNIQMSPAIEITESDQQGSQDFMTKKKVKLSGSSRELDRHSPSSHSDGCHSAGYHSDASSTHSELSVNVNVSVLKEYFEEKIIEVSQDATRAPSTSPHP